MRYFQNPADIAEQIKKRQADQQKNLMDACFQAIGQMDHSRVAMVPCEAGTALSVTRNVLEQLKEDGWEAAIGSYPVGGDFVLTIRIKLPAPKGIE